MAWQNLKGEFQVLLNDALALKRDTRALRPNLSLLAFRQPLRRLSERADRLSDLFSQSDAKLAQEGTLNANINGLIIEAASYSIVTSARESVRTLIHEIYADINDMRSQLNNSVSLILSVVAILVGVLAILVQAFGGSVV